MRNLKLTLQYDGTNYNGWQRQPVGSRLLSTPTRSHEP
jgi:tRNA U38,U39,U40 pseudouridine synthase TruA